MFYEITGVVFVSVRVKEAARLLGVSERRVRQLLADGSLAGERFGDSWMVSADDVARLQVQRRHPGRPLGPKRAWALLDLLGGGSAPWLLPPARSQLRKSLGRFAGGDADRWRSALHGRSDVRTCVAHRAAIDRLIAMDGVLAAGASRAESRGFDLVVSDQGVEEVYAPSENWSDIAMSLAIRPAPEAEANLRVRLPRLIWPFGSMSELPDAALAADLLESSEPRSVSAGVAELDADLKKLLTDVNP
jgi:excisionase family DNA binding protein